MQPKKLSPAALLFIKLLVVSYASGETILALYSDQEIAGNIQRQAYSLAVEEVNITDIQILYKRCQVSAFVFMSAELRSLV